MGYLLYQCFSWAPLHTTNECYAIVDAHFILDGGVT
jgi:hypothetical protein